MKWINKIIFIICTLFLVIMFIPAEALWASADETPTISVNGAAGKSGESVEVMLVVSNNTGIAGATVQITYDEKLTLESVANGEALEGLSFTKPEKLNSPCKFLWDSERGMSQQNGIILKMNFLISEEAIDGEKLSVQVSYVDGDIFDENLEDVTFRLEDGCVDVVNSPKECMHNKLSDWQIVNSPECESEGRKEAVCSECGKTISETIAPLGHDWSDWNVISKATVFEPEKQKRTCNLCKKEDIRKNGSALKPTMKITEDSLPLKTKQKVNSFSVTNMASGDYVNSWTSSNTSIVKVSGKRDGSCTIAAQSKTGTAKITICLKSGMKKTVTIKVQKNPVATTKITAVNKKVTINKGSSLQLKPVLTPVSSLEKITYSTSAKEIAAVSSKGKITAKAPGIANIKIKAGKKSFICTVTVPGISNVKSAISIKKGKSVTLKPEKYGINEKITFTSSNVKVATVSSNGRITGKKKGTAVITIKAGKYSVKSKITVK